MSVVAQGRPEKRLVLVPCSIFAGARDYIPFLAWGLQRGDLVNLDFTAHDFVIH